jgi:CheY-like chemotaxis protein
MAGLGTNKAPGVYERKNSFLLLVDGDANNLYYMSMVLQRLDYRITTARNSEEAISIAAIAEPFLSIVALDLAGVGGIELIQQLKQHPGTAHVPVIAIRKQDDLRGEQRSLEVGAAACLAYPLSAEKLFRAVQVAVETIPREYIRIRTLLPVQVNDVPLNGLGGASAVVLSERGIFLPTTRPAPVDTRLSIQIELRKRLIAVEAVVLYSNRTIGGPYQEPGMGMGFLSVSPKDHELIRQFIRNELTRGIAPLND